jgi:hypothetical protein
MNRTAFVNSLREHGDVYINYISSVSRKFKYHVATMDFRVETSPYIARKLAMRTRSIKLEENQVLVFCYDLDDFKPINTTDVISVVALNQVVRQPYAG